MQWGILFAVHNMIIRQKSQTTVHRQRGFSIYRLRIGAFSRQACRSASASCLAQPMQRHENAISPQFHGGLRRRPRRWSGHRCRRRRYGCDVCNGSKATKLMLSTTGPLIPPIADMEADIDFCRSGPQPDILIAQAKCCEAANTDQPFFRRAAKSRRGQCWHRAT